MTTSESLKISKELPLRAEDCGERKSVKSRKLGKWSLLFATCLIIGGCFTLTITSKPVEFTVVNGKGKGEIQVPSVIRKYNIHFSTIALHFTTVPDTNPTTDTTLSITLSLNLLEWGDPDSFRIIDTLLISRTDPQNHRIADPLLTEAVLQDTIRFSMQAEEVSGLVMIEIKDIIFEAKVSRDFFDLFSLNGAAY